MKRYVTFLILIIILLMLGCKEKTIKVPKLIGKDVDEARTIIEKAGLKLNVIGKIYSNFPQDQIFSQKPPEGREVKKGSAVEVELSLGTKKEEAEEIEEVKVPDLLGKNLEEAKELTKKSGFEIIYELITKDDMEKFVSWQYPDTGDIAQKGSKVYIILGNVKVKHDVSREKSDTFEKVFKSKRTICIDAGHQNKADLEKEPNAPGSNVLKSRCLGGGTGINSKTPEYVINLEVALKVEKKLLLKGYDVVMTRRTNEVNISNIERALIANEVGADLFLRIHADGSNNPSVKGVSTFYPANNEHTSLIYLKSKKAAELIQEAVSSGTGQIDRGIFPRSDITGFNWSNVPAVLLEMGFLSNPGEDGLLNDEIFQEKMAEKICEGVERFVNSLNP
ncbi:MAG: N-acetylmuramoyl-L-alanine amidase [Actinomycetia bacterium]|nr:N-acetylmuramoyl-L-alanine amidase [Actinomycetes bacterium]